MPSRARSQFALGALLLLTGTATMVFHVALVLIGDCSETCEARGEDLVAILLATVGGLLAIVGALVLRRAARGPSRAS